MITSSPDNEGQKTRNLFLTMFCSKNLQSLNFHDNSYFWDQ